MTDLWPLAALLGLLAAAALALTVRDWRFGALALALALPFEGLLPELGAGGMKALVGLVLLALTVHLLRDGALRQRLSEHLRTDLSVLLAALTLLCALSALWAQSPAAALGRALTFAGAFALLHLFALLDEPWLRRAWGALLLSAALTVPVGLRVVTDGPFADEGRFTSGGLNPNDYAGLLLIVLFVGAAAHSGPGARPLRLLLAAVVLGGLLLTGSRTAFVALAAAPLLYLALSPVRGRALRAIVLAYGAVAAVSGTVYALSPSQAEALRARALTVADYRTESTWLARLTIWRGAWDMVRAQPVLGVGAGNFPLVSHRYARSSAPPAEGRPGPVAHNALLGVTAELGVVGLALFGALVWRLLVRARRLAAHDTFGSALLLGVIAWLLMGLTLSWEYVKIAYVLMGSALALAAARTREPA